MPTYDYICYSCNYKFEYFQAMTDEPLRICPKCGSEIYRLISGGTGLIFKGSGFYITDYKRKADSTRKSSEQKSDSDKTKTSKSSETKKGETKNV